MYHHTNERILVNWIVKAIRKEDNLMDYLYGNLTLGARQDYILPIASQTTLGGVKVDGKTIFISEDGTISCNPLKKRKKKKK